MACSRIVSRTFLPHPALKTAGLKSVPPSWYEYRVSKAFLGNLQENSPCLKNSDQALLSRIFVYSPDSVLKTAASKFVPSSRYVHRVLKAFLESFRLGGGVGATSVNAEAEGSRTLVDVPGTGVYNVRVPGNSGKGPRKAACLQVDGVDSLGFGRCQYGGGQGVNHPLLVDGKVNRIVRC